MSTPADNLRAACHGHPAAKVPWPHRVLHEGADEIERLEAALCDVIKANNSGYTDAAYRCAMMESIARKALGRRMNDSEGGGA